MVKGVARAEQSLLKWLGKASELKKEQLPFLKRLFKDQFNAFYAARVRQAIAKLPRVEQIQQGGRSLESLCVYGGQMRAGVGASRVQAFEQLIELSGDGVWNEQLKNFRGKFPQAARVWDNSGSGNGITSVDGASEKLHKAALREGFTQGKELRTALQSFDKSLDQVGSLGEKRLKELGRLAQELGELKHEAAQATAVKTKLDGLLREPLKKRVDAAVAQFDAREEKGEAFEQLVAARKLLGGPHEEADHRIGAYREQLKSQYERATNGLNRLMEQARKDPQKLGEVQGAVREQRAAFEAVKRHTSQKVDAQQEALESKVRELPAEVRGILEKRRGALGAAIQRRQGQLRQYKIRVFGVAERELNREGTGAKAVHEKAVERVAELRGEIPKLAKAEIDKLKELPGPLVALYEKQIGAVQVAGGKLEKDPEGLGKVVKALREILELQQILFSSRAEAADKLHAGAAKSDRVKIDPYYHNLSMDPMKLIRQKGVWESLAKPTKEVLRAYSASWDKYAVELGRRWHAQGASSEEEYLEAVAPRGVSAIHVFEGGIILGEVQKGLGVSMERLEELRAAKKTVDEVTRPALNEAQRKFDEAQAKVAEDERALKEMGERLKGLEEQIGAIGGQLDELEDV